MSSAEYWDLTPRQFAFLARAHQQAEKRWDIRLSALWWRYANAHRGKDARVIPFAEMFPELVEDHVLRATPERKHMTDEQIIYNLEMWAAVQKPGTVRITRTPIDKTISSA